MSDPQNDQFFRDKFFQALDSRFAGLGEQIAALSRKTDEQTQQLTEIKAQIRYIYGWAAGIGFIGAFLWSFIKEKLGVK